MRHAFAWLVLLAAWPLPVSAQSRITVALYDLAGLRQEDRKAMKQETTKILREAGVELEWVDCEVAGKNLNFDGCAQPAGLARLML